MITSEDFTATGGAKEGARGVGEGCDSGVMGPGCAHIFGFPKIDFQKYISG